MSRVGIVRCPSLRYGRSGRAAMTGVRRSLLLKAFCVFHREKEEEMGQKKAVTTGNGRIFPFSRLISILQR